MQKICDGSLHRMNIGAPDYELCWSVYAWKRIYADSRQMGDAMCGINRLRNTNSREGLEIYECWFQRGR